MDYSELPVLSRYFLEDSFVLAIDDGEQSLTFALELVLAESHPDYAHPQRGEQHCYATGRLVFSHPSGVDWLSRTGRVTTDAAGARDMGNIDVFTWEGTAWRLCGAWGEVVVTTSALPFIALCRSADV